MKKAIQSSILITLFVLGVCAFAASCSNTDDYEIFGAIHGLVTDSSDGLPLDNATVVLSPSGQTKQTDASGNFHFGNLEIQQYTLTVQKQGYQPNLTTVTVVSGEGLLGGYTA